MTVHLDIEQTCTKLQIHILQACFKRKLGMISTALFYHTDIIQQLNIHNFVELYPAFCVTCIYIFVIQALKGT